MSGDGSERCDVVRLVSTVWTGRDKQGLFPGQMNVKNDFSQQNDGRRQQQNQQK